MEKIIKFVFILKSLLLILIRLFFNYLNGGEKCIICGEKSYIYPLCRKCKKKYFHITKENFAQRCEKCGKELISTEKLCTDCKEKTILKSTNKVIPLFSYRLWNKELLFMWKINCVRNLSYFFASLVYKTLKIMNYDVIVPVPPRKGKIKKNGWDQIDELTNILEKVYGIKKLKLLKRLSKEEQKKLNREERLETIKSAYHIVDEKDFNREMKRVEWGASKSLCLIDDVCTTGSTVECCSEILKSAGFKEVNVITLFIVD